MATKTSTSRNRYPATAIYIPDDLKREFKKACVDRGIKHMSDPIEQMIRNWLDNPNIAEEVQPDQ